MVRRRNYGSKKCFENLPIFWSLKVIVETDTGKDIGYVFLKNGAFLNQFHLRPKQFANKVVNLSK